jgi:hypothetical protein
VWHGVSHMNMLNFNQILSHFPYPPAPYCSTALSVFHYSSSCTDTNL